MYYKSIFLLIFGLFALVINLAAKIAKEDEIYLPFQAHLTENFFPDDNSEKLEEGTLFIILRPLDNDLILVEFPRRGVYSISPDITDVHNLVSDAKKMVEEEYVALRPRMSYFLGNRIISGKSGWQVTLQEIEMKDFTRWILLYGDSDKKSTIEAIEIADTYFVSLDEAERKKTALIYMDPTGNKGNIQSIADALKPSIYSMPAYLSRGYSKSLAHLGDVEEFPFLVELETSGRIISEHEGLDKVKAFFKKNK